MSMADCCYYTASEEVVQTQNATGAAHAAFCQAACLPAGLRARASPWLVSGGCISEVVVQTCLTVRTPIRPPP